MWSWRGGSSGLPLCPSGLGKFLLGLLYVLCDIPWPSRPWLKCDPVDEPETRLVKVQFW
jgi:hypothetical protein